MADLVFLDPRRRPRPLLRTLVGDVLRRHRLTQSRTLADVARAARVSMPYLSEVERGRKEASSEVLAAVCAALRIDLSDLLAEVWHDLAAEPADLRRRSPGTDRTDRVDRTDRAGRGELVDRSGRGELVDCAGRAELVDRGEVWGRRAAGSVPGRPDRGGAALPARGSSDVVLLAA